MWGPAQYCCSASWRLCFSLGRSCHQKDFPRRLVNRSLCDCGFRIWIREMRELLLHPSYRGGVWKLGINEIFREKISNFYIALSLLLPTILFQIFFILYWSIVDLQCCISFRCTENVLCIDIDILLFKFFSHLVFYRIASRDPYAIQ